MKTRNYVVLVTFLLTIFTLLLLSCQKSENVSDNDAVLPTIDANTETEIAVWGWNVAAKGLEATVASFNNKYPKIKVTVTEFGGTTATYERVGVVLASGQGVPDVLQIESDFVQTYSENYPDSFLDMRNLVPKNWENTMDPSKVPVSYDTEGRLTSIPWDSGPVVMYYRVDMFKQAEIDINTIETYEDFIAAGKLLQSKLPGVKMTGFGFTQDDGIWRNLMVQSGTYYLNNSGDVTLSGQKAAYALSLVKKFIDEGIVLDTVNWDGGIRASKSGQVASTMIGGWWGGTLKDQMPEMSGLWKIARIPAFEKGGVRASSQGGSALMITAQDQIKQAASWAFIENALFTVDGQLTMYDKFGLFPSYLPTYDDIRFKQSDPYFGDQDYNIFLGNVTKDIPPSIYNSEDYAEIRDIAVSAFEDVLNNNSDVQRTLDNAAAQINSATGRKITK